MAASTDKLTEVRRQVRKLPPEKARQLAVEGIEKGRILAAQAHLARGQRDQAQAHLARASRLLAVAAVAAVIGWVLVVVLGVLIAAGGV